LCLIGMSEHVNNSLRTPLIRINHANNHLSVNYKYVIEKIIHMIYHIQGGG
jgi:hypothetical protein